MSIKEKKPAKVEDGEITALSLPDANPSVPPSTYTPEGYKDQEEYLDDVRETYKLDLEWDQDNREAAMEDKRFAAGEQWDPIVLQERKGLPCLTIDTISQFTAQVVGDWRMNKIAVKVLPAENGDKNVADIRADLIRSIETKSRAARVYDNAFESMVQCGDGALRVGVQYAGNDVFDQDIVIQPLDDSLSVVWDRLSIDPTGRDATHCFVDDVLPEKEFQKRWPECDPSLLRDADKRAMQLGGWIDNKTVRVTEHWRLIEREKLLILFTDGTVYCFNDEPHPEDIIKFVQSHGKPVKTRMAPVTFAQMHLVTGFKILSGPYEYELDRLPVIRMTGRVVTVGDKRVRHGLVRKMKDAVRLRNFFRSIAAEQLGYAPKAKWLAPESAVEGREEAFRKAHLSRDPLLVYNDDAEAPPELIPPPQIEAALLNEAQQNAQDLKDVTGIHDASLGIKSNETSGKAIQTRQREGDIANLTYYDNGNAAVLETGDVINQLIGQIYDGTRIVRIIGEDESSKLVKINDPMDPNSPNIATGKYDVAISTGASFTTRRAEAAEAMMNAIQVYPEMMQIAGDLIVKAQDWPGAEELSERLLKTIPPELLSDKDKAERGDQPDMQGIMQQQADTQDQLAKCQEELQKLQMENLSLKTKENIEAQKLEVDKFKAETDRLTAYAAVLKVEQEQELRRLEMQAHEHEQMHTQFMDAAGAVDEKEQFQQGRQDDMLSSLTDKAHEAEQAELAPRR
jgi:hypothetical protein